MAARASAAITERFMRALREAREQITSLKEEVDKPRSTEPVVVTGQYLCEARGR